VRHNMRVGTLNRTAHRYIGHFDVSLKNRVASLRGCAAHALREDPTDYGAWINLNNYAQTNEPFGLLPFDDQTRKCVSMLPFDNSMPSKQHPNSTTRHWFLSGLQGTRFTVLPVHTRKEHTLFQSLIHSSPLFANTQQPDFVAIASMFNSHANSIDIFYKLPEHVKAHYKTWLDHVNEKASVSLSIDLTRRVRDLLAAQGTPVTILTARPRPLADTVSTPTREPNQLADEPPAWELNVQTQCVDSDGLESHQHTLQYHFADHPSRSEPGGPISAATMSTSCKRPANDTAGDSERNMKKSKRTCTYCSSAECKGRGGQRFCPKKGLDDQRDTEVRTRAVTEAAAH